MLKTLLSSFLFAISFTCSAIFTEEFDALTITVDRVEFVTADDDVTVIELDPAAALVLQNVDGIATVIAGGLPSGDYVRVNLNVVADSLNNQVLVGSEAFPLVAIANKFSFVGPFTVDVNGLLMFDADLQKVLHLPKGNGRFAGVYRLKPVIPILNLDRPDDE